MNGLLLTRGVNFIGTTSVMAAWRNGGMEEWRNGGMEEWRNGGMEVIIL